jgi:uncharacterized protein YndB with AHSA1/START domain
MASHEDLAVFDDRYTLRYVRVFRAPIERVWRAVTTSEELNLWFFPISRVEPRLRGAVSFTFGGPERKPPVGEVTVLEPLRRIRFQWRVPGAKTFFPGYLEFALEPVPEGTRFTFVDKRIPGLGADQRGVDPNDKAASLPGGPDTPWRPGFVAGFHQSVDRLSELVLQDWSSERIRQESEQRVAVANGTFRRDYPSEVAFLEDRYGVESTRRWGELVEIYWEYIGTSCPPAVR